MILLSITGAFRTILIVIAVFVILRYVGQILSAKRNMSEDQRHREERDALKKAKEESERNKGKIHVVQGNQPDVVDVDFEEVKEGEADKKEDKKA